MVATKMLTKSMLLTILPLSKSGFYCSTRRQAVFVAHWSVVPVDALFRTIVNEPLPASAAVLYCTILHTHIIYSMRV